MLGYGEIYNKHKTNVGNFGLEESEISKGEITGARIDDLNKNLSIFKLSDLLLSKETILSVGVEEDNVFEGIGDNLDDNNDAFDSSDDFNDDAFDSDSDGDNPFDSDDSFFSDGDDNPFGAGSDSESRKAQPQVLDRIESIKEKFDLSKSVRRNFPDYIFKLQDILSSSIEIIERRDVLPKYQKLKEELVIRYRETLNLVRSYLSEMDGETYEDIFKTYVKFWSLINKLKMSANKILS